MEDGRVECQFFVQQDTGIASLAHWKSYIDVVDESCEPSSCFFEIAGYDDQGEGIELSEIVSFDIDDGYIKFNTNHNRAWVFFHMRCINDA